MNTILETKELCRYYGTGDALVKAVDHVSIRIGQGEFVTVVGRSGSGKSTLLHLLGGLDRPTSGEILMEGQNIAAYSKERMAAYRRRKIGFVFQAYNLIPSLNVWENMLLPVGLDGRKADTAYAEEILHALGMEEKRYSLPNTLSGGQQQRCAIARALAAQPAVILADEPTGNLDSKNGDEVMSLLKTTAKRYGQTLVVITHNEAIAQTADRTLVIEDGKVVG